LQRQLEISGRFIAVAIDYFNSSYIFIVFLKQLSKRLKANLSYQANTLTTLNPAENTPILLALINNK
jgi:hypothetical protein